MFKNQPPLVDHGLTIAHLALPFTQIRIEELTDAADSPPELKDCLFQVGWGGVASSRPAAWPCRMLRHGLCFKHLRTSVGKLVQ